MQLFEPMCERSHCRGKEFLNCDCDFLEDKWLTNGCIPIRIDCSALFYDCDRCDDQLLGSASCATTFVGFGSS